MTPMPELPSGTVTFLFTDIEGSTKLLHELGAEAYAEALAEHRRLLREAFARNGGVEVDTQGDAFFVAFPTAPGALEAAAEAQEALAAGPIRVRMGLHTGTPLVAEENYVGYDVHRAARIAAVAHGGQVVVSVSTAALTGRDGLRDLGEHRLKDLSAPERIYQLGEEDFPPLKSLYRTNLPVPATPFLGRERELEEVSGLLAREDVRLVTLTGPGGTGKTRLALQAAGAQAERFPDGVWWVPLAAVRDAELVLQEAAQVLGSRNGLAEHIADKRLLLLFDNFEQVADAAPGLAALLDPCLNLEVLATSREPLRLAAEREYPVPTLAEREAVALFAERATVTEPDQTVRAICRRLDCLPLAVELAAARTKALSPEQILERLEQRLPLLTGGPRDAPERQRTLRATIEWSHELLAPEELALFRRLAVFAGGCSLDAAEAVCEADLDTLQSLVEKSLVRHTGERFWMLETIREFALERLEESGEAEPLRGRHAGYFATMAETADPQMRGGPLQALWLGRVEAEFDNVRAAMHWALDKDPETAVRLVAGLDWFFWVRGRLAEAAAWLERALASEGARDLRLRARALLAAGVVAGQRDDPEAETRYADESFALYSELGDEAGQAAALREQGKAAVSRGDHAHAAVLYEECISLAQRIGDVFSEAVARNNLGDIANREGRWEDAIELCSQSRSLRIDFGDRWGAALTLSNVAFAELHLGRRDEAERDLRQALREGFEMGSLPVVSACLGSLAALASDADNPSRAARLMGAEEAILEESGMVLYGAELTLHEPTVASVRAALGDEGFASELDLGRKLSFDEAVKLALDDDA
jgi:predicted ATPase/class 3 adenylate cyclase